MRSLPLIAAALFLGAAAAGADVGGEVERARCVDGGDRVTKLNLIERLPRNPGILVLGSSRVRTAEPAFLQRLTGRSGFNAAVTGGTAADAWVMTRFVADRFPRSDRGYLWFVGTSIATDGINPDLAAEPRARPYLGSPASARGVGCHPNRLYRADGSIAHPVTRSPRRRARIVARTVAEILANLRRHPPHAVHVDPKRYRYFERTIRFANEHGSRPVIVLNPIHPRVLAVLRRYGLPKRRAALDYLRRLRARLDFVVVDCEDIRAWGGSKAGFTDATHVDRVNMRRLLRYVVAHSDGALG